MPDTLPIRLSTLTARCVAAYVRHARRPAVQGATDEHLRYWGSAYAARAAINDGNPVFAATLLPQPGGELPIAGGLPLLPSGVRWVVDEAAPGRVTVTVDVVASAGVQATVTPPATEADTAPPVVMVQVAPTRTTLSFAAPADGLYLVALRTTGGPLATLCIPVQRRAFRQFREQVRHHGYAFRAAQPPLLDRATRLRLALLAGAESAATTNQTTLADTLRHRAEQLPTPPTPTALYPFARG